MSKARRWGWIGLGVLSWAGIACDTTTEEPPAPSRDIKYGAPGSLVSGAGKGGFRLGAASAATQIEDQNTRTDWYAFSRRKVEGDPPETKALGKGKAHVGEASKGYSKALEDVGLLKEMKLDSYRFSMEWARIEPRRNEISEEAIAHYRGLLEKLKAEGIRPVVTVHHFSNPIWIDDPADIGCSDGPNDENLCGLGHPTGGAQVVAEMEEHARLLAQRFGDLVDDWGTLNEPVNYLLAGHFTGIFPPGKSLLTNLTEEGVRTQFIPVVRDYMEAHARMYRAIKDGDKADADGDGDPAAVGLSLSVAEWVPSRDGELSDNPDDIAARDRVKYVYHYLVADSFLNGTFDANLDGSPDEDHPTWKGTLDWLGVQHYFRAGVTAKNALIPLLNVTPCFNALTRSACVPPIDRTYCVEEMNYEYNPPGLYEVLREYTQRYPGLPMVVSEAGIATENGKRRAENVVRVLEQIERARVEGSDVRGYYHWSLFDNFEWAEGFLPRFGLYKVDYSTYARTPTEGARVLGQIAGSRTLSAALRDAHGGTGPLTPEHADEELPEMCTR
ncbi:MAG: family 1 glycosylhydrolase [Polyangiaceae bacterium]|jgi:beta-glucosidase|nr:family 1 glycosylhydrolase [Polyangiaceae bacterium]